MLVFLMCFALMIKTELVHRFLMGLRVFKVVGEKNFQVDEQVCDLWVFLFRWRCLLANKLTKSILIF